MTANTPNIDDHSVGDLSAAFRADLKCAARNDELFPADAPKAHRELGVRIDLVLAASRKMRITKRETLRLLAAVLGLKMTLWKSISNSSGSQL
jgi:hypothetical protein